MTLITFQTKAVQENKKSKNNHMNKREEIKKKLKNLITLKLKAKNNTV